MNLMEGYRRAGILFPNTPDAAVLVYSIGFGF
jgi:hypothetical protein